MFVVTTADEFLLGRVFGKVGEPFLGCGGEVGQGRWALCGEFEAKSISVAAKV